MSASRLKRCFALHGRHNWLVLIGVGLVVAAWSAVTAAQQSGKNSAAKEAFGESAVDAIAARIKADLKDLKSSTLETPVATETGSLAAVAATWTPKSGRLKIVEANVQKCRTADEAAVLYKICLADPALSDDDREEAEPRWELWEQAAADQLVRVGPKWMLKSEADAIQQEADKLVADAVELLNVNNFVAAKAKLELASKVCPEHLEAMFVLGVGAYQNQDFKLADTKFTQCLSRMPNHVPLLNNAALCEAHLKRYEKAVKLWDHAASIDPENQTIAQNLGLFILDANGKKFPVERRVLSMATKTYEAMIERDAGNRTVSSRGYVLTKGFRSSSSSETKSPDEGQMVGTGTGIVMADGFVLTTRQVVEDSEALAIVDPIKSHGLPHSAQVVATDKDRDLVLIECRGLKAAPVPVYTIPVRRDSEVMVLGFPLANLEGKGVIAIRGTVTGLPSDDMDKMLVLDVPANPGNSGGPVCDAAGRAVGIVSSKSFKPAFGESSAIATPINVVIEFVKKSVSEYSPPKPDAKAADWIDVDARISQSTVLILMQKKR